MRAQRIHIRYKALGAQQLSGDKTKAVLAANATVENWPVVTDSRPHSTLRNAETRVVNGHLILNLVAVGVFSDKRGAPTTFHPGSPAHADHQRLQGLG